MYKNNLHYIIDKLLKFFKNIIKICAYYITHIVINLIYFYLLKLFSIYMKHKTNLFYTTGPDSKFLTFSNYAESLTGSFLSTNNKLFPTAFLALNIPDLDSDEKKQNFISQYLCGYYENKLAALREYAIDNNMNAESFLCPLNMLLECIEKWSKKDESTDDFSIVYVGDVTEQDYNGVYADTICTLDLNNAKKGEIEYNDDIDIELNAIEVDETYLHGWNRSELDNISESNPFSVYKTLNPIYDKTIEGEEEYYTEEEANAHNAELSGAIQPHTVKSNLQNINFCMSAMLPNGSQVSGMDFNDYASGTFELIEYVEGENINYYKVKITSISWSGIDTIVQTRRNLNWMGTGGRDKYFYIIEGSQNMPNHLDMNLLYDSINDLPATPNDIGSPSPFTLQNVDGTYHPDTNQVILYLRTTTGIIDNIILYTEEDANNYNARLDGAVHEGDVKALIASGNYYYTKSNIERINLLQSTDTEVTFNAIVLLYDMIDITSNNEYTSTIVENNIIDLILDESSNILANRNCPFGFWIADKSITINIDNRTNTAPTWSLSVLSQFRPTPYNLLKRQDPSQINNINTFVDLSTAEKQQAYVTFAQILARQNIIISKYEEVLNSIQITNEDLREKINTLTSQLNTNVTELTESNTTLQNRINLLVKELNSLKETLKNKNII